MTVLAPSDLKTSPEQGPIVLAGRVLQAGHGCFVLADAFEAVSVNGSTDPPLSAGDLVKVRVLRGGDTLTLLAVESGARAPEPMGTGEFLRLQASGRASALRARSTALGVVRSYFARAGFVEVETPTLGICPGLDPHVHSLGKVSGFSGPAADSSTADDSGTGADSNSAAERYLMTSPEFFMKRLLSAGVPRLFQVSRSYRKDEVGLLHEPEFTLVEWYRAFESWDRVLFDTEQLVRQVYEAVSPESPRQKPLPQGPFPRLSVREAFRRYAGVEDAALLAETDPDSYFQKLVDHVQPGLADTGGPVFLTDFPRSEAALARLAPEDSSVAERFELTIDGVELCNGYGELTDEPLQRTRFLAEQARRRSHGEPEYPLDERFLSALREGMPEAAGNALGFDRLVMLALGRNRLKDVIAFSADEV